MKTEQTINYGKLAGLSFLATCKGSKGCSQILANASFNDFTLKNK